MNPQKELQQMQDLSLKLDIPIWKISRVLWIEQEKTLADNKKKQILEDALKTIFLAIAD